MKEKLFLVFFLSVFAVVSCDSFSGDSESNIDPEELFDYATTVETEIVIQTLDNDNIGVPGINFSVLISGQKTIEGVTNSEGLLNLSLSLPAHVAELVIHTDFLFYYGDVTVPIVNGKAEYVYEGFGQRTESSIASISIAKTSSIPLYTYMGDYDSEGVPDYLEPTPDDMPLSLLEYINFALPEQVSVPDNHSDYIAEGSEANIVLNEDADIWITFVHEGAGFRNALGYYTYTVGNSPETVDDIDSLIIIFPNASYEGNGGGLQSGDKVFLGSFQANTVLGWFVISNGWNGTDVGSGLYRLFSNPELNPGYDSGIGQHNVLLNSIEHDILLLGFEDIARPGGDKDFNDALFYITANPPEAVTSGNIVELPTPPDTDGDGVYDEWDAYREDPQRAFNNYFPAENSYGTLAFEDYWPSLGDYDFNDLVVGYNFNQVTNVNNWIVDIQATLIVRAIGASYKNGFGIELPLIPSTIHSVEGQLLTESIIDNASNGVESGQSYAVIIFFDNAFSLFNNYSGFINTQPDGYYAEPETLKTTITFTNPISPLEINNAPYNPFIIINKERSREVHLANHTPTDLANTDYFGTKNDTSIPEEGRFFKDTNNMPWGLHFADGFDYPKEYSKLYLAYHNFSNWSLSAGLDYTNWYLDLSGYRNSSLIYSR